MHDSIALAAARYSDLALHGIALLAVAMLLLQVICLLAVTVFIRGKQPQDRRQ